MSRTGQLFSLSPQSPCPDQSPGSRYSPTIHHRLLWHFVQFLTSLFLSLLPCACVCVCVCAYTCIHVCISLRCEYLMRSGLADLYIWNVLLIPSVSRVSSCACSFASLELNNFLFPAWIPRRHRLSLLPGLVSETVYNRASIVL